MNSWHHLSEGVPQHVPAGVVEEAGQAISARSNMEIGCPDRLFNFIFVWSFLQHVIISLSEYWLYAVHLEQHYRVWLGGEAYLRQNFQGMCMSS